jgi:diguanylate cyclase (GGDEF)-like protein
MTDHLRESIEHTNKADMKRFEDFFRHGLILPVDHVGNKRTDMHTLEEVFSFWASHSDIDVMLPPGAAFILTNADLTVIDACADHSIYECLPLATGSSWSELSVGDNAIVRCAASGNYSYILPQEHTSLLNKKLSGCAIAVYSERQERIGNLGIITQFDYNFDAIIQIFPFLTHAFKNSASLLMEQRKNECLAQIQWKNEQEAKKRDVLFQVSKKLHAKIDVNSVLTEVIESIYQLYPNFQADLLLTQDSQGINLPIKPLNFTHNEDDLCTRAFMEGQLIYEPYTSAEAAEFGRMAVPLSGKQGVYGVLHLQTEQELIDSTEIEFISILADLAGSAFENAKLYEQSNFLINELRLINEITKRLNQSLRLNDICNFASNELITIFDADYCCIMQTDKEKEKLIVQATNLPAIYHDMFTLEQGFGGIVYATKEPLIISDYWENAKVKSKLMEMTHSRSLIASPIIVNEEVIGVILVVHSKPNFFSYDNYKLLQVLSGHIGLAMTNASLHAEVRRMVITDNLTGLYVRHYLDEQANLMQKKDFCGSLILADIDNFKRVNDSYGHQVGDKILIQVSNIIKTSIRDSDIAARWGGEELAVYLPQVAIEQTLRIAERIRERVMKETNPQVTVSCGVSDWNWEDDKISVEALFYKADMALYQAKDGGRNQIKVG